MASLIGPELDRKLTIMPQTTTVDRKWGRYEMDCTSFLYRSDLSSLSSSASKMGAGKEKISE